MEYIVTGEDEMKQLGVRIAHTLKGGEVLELVGDIGAGKTTLTKGIAAGLGIAEDVQSPSFTISRTYETPSGLQLAHYDFYRLTDPGILLTELNDLVGDPETIVIIEWAEVVNEVLPTERITITIESPSEERRLVRIAPANLLD